MQSHSLSYFNQDSFSQNPLNETNVEIRTQKQLRVQLQQISPKLLLFYRSQLQNDFKLDDLDNKSDLLPEDKIILPSLCNLYFTPCSILIPPTDLRTLRKKIISEHQIWSTEEKEQQLLVQINNKSGICNYSIRPWFTLPRNSSKEQFEKKPQSYEELPVEFKKQLLDSKVLIKKLFDYYNYVYKELWVGETIGCILYWVYQKKLTHLLPDQAIVILCLDAFIGFGYGISNIIKAYLTGNVEEKGNICNLKSQNNIYKYTSKTHRHSILNKYITINNFGQCILDQQLFRQFTNFTLLWEKGLYSRRHSCHQILVSILPIPFPLTKQQYVEHKSKTKCEKVLKNEIEKASLAQNIFKVMHYLSRKINQYGTVTIDLCEDKEILESNDSFALKVLHPIMKTNLTPRLKETNQVYMVRTQIMNVQNKINGGHPVVDIFKFMFGKK